MRNQTAKVRSIVRAKISADCDTIIVPAKKEDFQKVFLEKGIWQSIPISSRMIPEIKYIAAYQGAPISAITYVAPVARIEMHGDRGRYKLIFSEPAKPIGPIPLGNAPPGLMYGPRYTAYEKLIKAKEIAELLARK